MLLAGMLLLVAAAMAADDHAGHDHGAHGHEKVRLLALFCVSITDHALNLRLCPP